MHQYAVQSSSPKYCLEGSCRVLFVTLCNLKYTAFVLFTLSLILFVLKSARLATHRNAVILNPVVNLKSEPRPQSTTVSVIHDGLKVEISKGWIEQHEAGEI